MNSTIIDQQTLETHRLSYDGFILDDYDQTEHEKHFNEFIDHDFEINFAQKINHAITKTDIVIDLAELAVHTV